MDDDEWLDSLWQPEAEVVGFEEAESRNSDEGEEALRALLESIEVLSEWNTDASILLGAGWKENALLAETGEVASAFSQLEVDLFAYRPGFGRRAEVLALLYGEYRYFEAVPGLDAESMAMGQSSIKWPLGWGWQGGFFGEAMYSVQAFDASSEEFVTDAATVRVWQPELGASLGRTLGELGAFEWTVQVGDVLYDQESENYGRAESSWALTSELGGKSRLRLSFDLYQENYDERRERISVGVLGGDEVLEMKGSRAEVVWKYGFENKSILGMKTLVSYEGESDAVGDYYERESWKGKQSVELAGWGWDVDIAVSYGTVDYASRRVALFSEETRSDSSWRWNFDARRALGRRFDVLLRVEDVEKKSNVVGLSYEGMSVYLGIQWQADGGS